MLLPGRVDHYQSSAVGGLQLYVGVQQFDAEETPVGADVDIHLVGDDDGFHVFGLGSLPEADVGDVVSGIVGQPHRRTS
jgi:hypothetical protein